MKRLFLTLVAATILSVYQTALAQNTASLEYAPKGTTLLFRTNSNGNLLTQEIMVRSPDGVEGRFSRYGLHNRTYYPGCWGCGNDRSIEERKYAELWPLEVGKSVEFIRKRSDGSRSTVSIIVASRERISTMAGEFDTFVLEGTIENIDGTPWRASKTDWWSPEIGWVVKSDGTDSDGDFYLFELVRKGPISFAIPESQLASAVASPRVAVDQNGIAVAGTQFDMSFGGFARRATQSWTVLPVSLPKMSFQRPEGNESAMYPGCYACRETTRIDEQEYAKLWPLAVGNSVSFDRVKKGGARARVSISVVGTERVTTIAGDFDTYVIMGTIRARNGRKFGTATHWWAPEVGWVVKYIGSNSVWKKYWEYELTGF